jgi:precorrin-6x reductase
VKEKDGDKQILRTLLAQLVADARTPYGVSTSMQAIEDCAASQTKTARDLERERIAVVCDSWAVTWNSQMLQALAAFIRSGKDW